MDEMTQEAISQTPMRRLAAGKGRVTVQRTVNFVGSVAIILAGWFFIRATHIVNPALFPSMPAVAKAAGSSLADGTLLRNVLVSLWRVLVGFGCGMCLAIVCGMALGTWRALGELLDPAINFFRALPPIALIPIMIICFGIGEAPKMIVLTYAAFFPALVVIYQAFIGLDPIFVRAAKMLGASNREIFWRIMLPQLVPAIVTAARVSLAVCWATLVAAELIAAQHGIGAMMVDAQNFFEMPRLMLGVVLIGIISLAMDLAVRAVEKRMTVWRETAA